ncbi:type II toxin-antitoxin system Phd/YefM family antitoxin [Actinobacillus porcinus]|uniref:type II toxin-antitoxin system Phd/YefM family antitoxin n=1 Tax=Actinobacillus porcinus TaxID=51048 RepID=UPI002356A3E9|nr:type II toxin-antitoxin system prevent-host-death family antitoxin [Actinobacillus porcinus]MCI5765018.1 type II toxin-antitoxin system prevent-host-death family antitoxin [Actinobacillus porcinus]MDD7544699.1 type II toxin-antitoxin system prevent-host-death family antitoxin [Actinobacillus porcinus]MDY5422505.1 type II toxin-antitoxin system prevent-host-death family antitoxin [Actinobacillus porcinus]MDY5848901.1 type II toxin-antitoxin system prevent-host-death family antitoxin [Actinoba
MLIPSAENVNIHEAKTHFSRLVDEVKRFGKPIVIAKSGKPQVKIVPLDNVPNGSRFGFMKNQSVNIPENFDRLYEDEIAAMFEGKSE